MINYKIEKLKNDLPVVLAPVQGTETVTVFFLVATGSKYETKEQNGLSHFLEHMFFKGTKKRPSTLDISETLDKVGGVYNAFTGKEYTGFYTKLAHGHLDLALDVLSDILINSLFRKNDADREKGVILEEIKLYKDTPTAYIHELFEELLYGPTPAGRKIIGTAENIKSFSDNQTRQYFKNHYSSLNSCLVIAGNFDDKALDKASKYFTSFPKRSAEKKESVKEAQQEPASSFLAKKTDQTHLSLGVRTFDMFDERKYPLALLNIILGGGMSSRLFTTVREKAGLAYYIKSDHEAYTDTGYLTTLAGVKHENLEKTIEIILKEFQKLKNTSPAESELNKAREYFKGTTLMSLEASHNIASFLGKQFLLKKKVEKPEEVFRKLDKVKPVDIKKLANEIFQPSGLNLSIISPSKYKNKELNNLLTFK